MAGYKTSVKDDDAVSLWTFDGDAYDSWNRNLIVPEGEPKFIIDEIDNLNPAILHNDHETYLGYRLGMTSLIDQEQTDQHAIGFGFAGKQPSHPNQWAKAYLEIPHTISYSFPRYGSFSVEFVFYKQYTSDEGTSGYTSYTRPIISKGGVFNIYFNFPYWDTHTIVIQHPGGSTSVPLSYKPGYSLIGKITHFILVWEVTLENTGQYKGVARIFINGYLATEQTYTYFDVFPNTNQNTPILIAGKEGNNRVSDFHTSNFQMDQIGIYDKPLSLDEISNHFSKIFPYDTMIRL